MAASVPKARFEVLDAWRGICAICIVLMHIPIRESILAAPFIDGAYLFVDFFFVLSGFVIAHAYGAALENRPGEAVPFLIKRIGRLWPLNLAMFGVFLVPNVAHLLLYNWYGTSSHPPPPVSGFFFSGLVQITLLQSVFKVAHDFIWDGPSWSISTEFWTYVVFVIIALIFGRRQPWVKAAVVLGSLALMLLLPWPGEDDFSWFAFLRCFYGFFIGQLLYELFGSPRSQELQKRWPAGIASMLEIGVVIAIVVFVSKIGTNHDMALLAPVVFAVAIYTFAVERGIVSRLLRTAPFQKAGLYSYSIYMIHALLIALLRGLLRIVEKLDHVHLIFKTYIPAAGKVAYLIDFGSSGMMVGLSFLVVAITIYLASWTYRLIERPGQIYFGAIARNFYAPAGKRSVEGSAAPAAVTPE